MLSNFVEEHKLRRNPQPSSATRCCSSRPRLQNILHIRHGCSRLVSIGLRHSLVVLRCWHSISGDEFTGLEDGGLRCLLHYSRGIHRASWDEVVRVNTRGFGTLWLDLYGGIGESGHDVLSLCDPSSFRCTDRIELSFSEGRSGNKFFGLYHSCIEGFSLYRYLCS